jgi:hypothetical protein
VAPDVDNLRRQRKDGFANIEIRSINVAALLRVIFASIEYAPSQELKAHNIDLIRNFKNFRDLTMLCEATQWNPNYAIVSKYLRVMRHVLRTPTSREFEWDKMLTIYQWIAHVI